MSEFVQLRFYTTKGDKSLIAKLPARLEDGVYHLSAEDSDRALGLLGRIRKSLVKTVEIDEAGGLDAYLAAKEAR